MKIKFRNYTMTPEDSRFNLSKTVTAHKTGGLGKKATKDTEAYEKEEIMGYGMEFGTCLDKIAKDILAEKDEVVTIDTWLTSYSQIKSELLQITN